MGDTNGENKKKTAREIIENYNGPKVRIMEPIPMRYSVWESVNCYRSRWN